MRGLRLLRDIIPWTEASSLLRMHCRPRSFRVTHTRPVKGRVQDFNERVPVVCERLLRACEFVLRVVLLNMYACLYVSLHLWIYACMYAYARTYLHVHVCVWVVREFSFYMSYVCVWLSMYIRMYVCMCVCLCERMCACMYVCMYACAYACAHTNITWLLLNFVGNSI
jgi:hypothetical protein